MFFADERTLEAIEFAPVRERVVGQTRTERGRAYATSLLPNSDFERVRVEQARTAAARELAAAADFHVSAAIETAPLTLAASQGRTLAARELHAIGDAISAAAAAVRAARQDPALHDVVAAYQPVEDVRRAVTDAIDERGTIVDRASPALGRIRRQLRQAQDESRDRVSSLLRSPKYANAIQDAVVTIRDGRFVVPIKAEFAGEFPGIVHDSSSSGQTLFVEPLAALDANNRLRTLRIDEEREIERVLRELSQRVGERAASIEANVEILAHLDILVAKARVAESMHAAVPELDESATLEIAAGRHPLLGERAVPQSLRLDDEARLIVISGPNMGGKTVALKMVGLFLAMAYSGLQLPAGPGTRVGRFSTLVADIGDEQSIAADASTFSAHLDRMREILSVAGDRTMVLVDEIGAGTEPSAGAALAVAILEWLQQRRTRAVVTTHATELKLWAHAAERALNASVRFTPETFSPTYHLDVGSPGQSFSFALARARGIDESVVARAQTLLDAEQREYEQALQELSSRNAELQQARDALDREREETETQRAALAKRETALRTEQERFAQRADERLQRALRDFIADLARSAPEKRTGRPRLTPGQSAILARTIEAMHHDLGLRNAEPAEPVPQTVAFPLPGMREQRAERGTRLSAATATRAELDVRGRRYAEAEPLVDRWLDEAMLAGNSPLRLIHGKGTGMLGRGLQAFLREHPAVATIRYGTEEEGSHGVTIIELKN